MHIFLCVLGKLQSFFKSFSHFPLLFFSYSEPVMTTYASGRLHDHKHHQQQFYGNQAFWRDESSKKHSSIKLDTKIFMSGLLTHCDSQPFGEASCTSCFLAGLMLVKFSHTYTIVLTELRLDSFKKNFQAGNTAPHYFSGIVILSKLLQLVLWALQCPGNRVDHHRAAF